MDDNNNSVHRDHQESTPHQQQQMNKKWKCDECTYENWPCAVKCTLCRSVNKKQQFKLQQQQHHSKSSSPVPLHQQSLLQIPSSTPSSSSSACGGNSKDIYRLANLLINEDESSAVPPPPQQPQQPQIVDMDFDLNKKWNCSACTYLNWPKSKKCVQCYTPRSTTSSRRSSPKPHHPQPPPSSSHKSPRSSNPHSPCTIPKNTNLINESALPLLPSQQQQQPLDDTTLKKWTCSACTYENWPKASKCIMCKTNRQTTIAASSSSSTITQQQSIIPSIPRQQHQQQQGATSTMSNTNDLDRLFILACKGIVDNNLMYLNNYINSGGDITRYLTNEEVKILKRPQIFFTGLTLIHLCYQYKRTEHLMKFINSKFYQQQQQQNSKKSQQQARQQQPKKIVLHKYLPCQSCPLLALNIIERYFSSNLRQRNLQAIQQSLSCATSQQQPVTPSSCFYVNDCNTFLLPCEIELNFSSHMKNVILDELLDRDVQYELESSENGRIINWNVDLMSRLSSYLYPLWNRHSGDCLLDSVLQACYGVFDTENILRNVMAQCMDELDIFKQRWKEHELLMAQSLNYTIDDIQLEHDWHNLIMLAQQPGSSLEQAHIFALCHIFRRPIIIYSVKYVKSYKGENIGYSHFEGVYLPLLWEPSFCFKNPIVLGYTRGHFTALVHMERNYINNTSHFINSLSANNSNQTTSSNINTTATTSSSQGGGSSATQSQNTNSDMQVIEDNHLYCGAIVNSNDIGGDCCGATCVNTDTIDQTFYLPLTNSDGQLLPIHFLTASEIGKERLLLRQYFHLDCLISPSSNCGLLVSQLKVSSKRPMLVKQMLDEWLIYYREMQIKENQKQNIMVDIDVDEDEDDDDEEDDDEEDVDARNGSGSGAGIGECVVDVES